MSLDDQYTEFLRDQTLKARGGNEDMLSKEYVELLYALWKIMSLPKDIFKIEMYLHDKVNIIKAIMRKPDEGVMRITCSRLGIKKVQIREEPFKTLWFADPYRFVLQVTDRTGWIREPKWNELTIDTYECIGGSTSEFGQSENRMRRINRQPVANNVRIQGGAADIDWASVELRLYAAWREQFGHLEDNEEANLAALHTLCQDAQDSGMTLANVISMLSDGEVVSQEANEQRRRSRSTTIEYTQQALGRVNRLDTERRTAIHEIEQHLGLPHITIGGPDHAVPARNPDKILEAVHRLLHSFGIIPEEFERLRRLQ